MMQRGDAVDAYENGIDLFLNSRRVHLVNLASRPTVSEDVWLRDCVAGGLMSYGSEARLIIGFARLAPRLPASLRTLMRVARHVIQIVKNTLNAVVSASQLIDLSCD